MQCGFRSHCNLEATGAVDLCPVLQRIVTEAKEQTERDWSAKVNTQEAVPVDRFNGTARTIKIGFSLEIALENLAKLQSARRDKTLAEIKQSKKYNTTQTKARKQKGSRQTWGRKKTIPVHTFPWVKAESYSVYEYDTTPPAVPKTEIVMTRKEIYKRANDKELNRILNIKISRRMKLQRLMDIIDLGE